MDRPTTLELLRGARARVARGWCQGAMARDARGRSVACTSREAVAWCIAGGIRAEENGRSERHFQAAMGAIELVEWEGDGLNAISRNDSRHGTRLGALILLDWAIRDELARLAA